MQEKDDSIPLSMSWIGSSSPTGAADDDDPTADGCAAKAPHVAAALRRNRRLPVGGVDDSVALHAMRTIHMPAVTARQLNEACASLLAAYGGLIMSIVRDCLSGNDEDAEEVMADAVFTFVRKCPPDVEAPDLWLFKVAIRLAISRRRAGRSQGRRPPGGFEPLGAPGDGGPLDSASADPEAFDPLNLLLRRERQQILWSVLPQLVLSSKRRALALNLLIAGYSTAEIAARMQVKEGAVRDMLFRVRAFIRDILKEYP